MVEIDFHAIQILKCGTVNLELRCPQRIDGIAVNPDPYWKFDALILELKSLETRLNISAKVPAPFVKARSCDFSNEKGAYTSHWPFVIHASDDFDGFDDESDHEFQSYLMGEVGSVEGVLCELTHEHELDFKDPFIFTSIEFFLKSTTAAAAAASSTYYYQIFTEEEIRNKISALETDLMGRSEKSSSALTRVERYQEARWEIDRKLDAHYQRKIAEELDYHLSAVQWDHELRSQIEERKIRSDAAYEEAKRKEMALEEEKVRQEKAKVESEARLRAEEAKRAALEAVTREANEAADREAIETSTRAAAGVAQEEAARSQMDANSQNSNESKEFASDAAKKSQSASNVLRSAESALNLEQGRLQKFKEIDERNNALRLTYNKDFSSFERHISRLIKQISGTKEIVSEMSHEIFKIFNDPLCPQSISIAAFAKKVVSRCESLENDAFACGHVIVLVTSQKMVDNTSQERLQKFNEIEERNNALWLTYNKDFSSFERHF